MNIPPILQQIWDNPYASFAIIIFGSLLAAKGIRWLVAKPLVRWAAATEGTDLDDKLVALLEPVVVKCIVIGGFLLAVHRTGAREGMRDFVANLLLSVIVIIVSRFLFSASRMLVEAASLEEERFHLMTATTLPLFDNLVKLLVVAGAAYLVISIWGIDATGWLASAGVLGIAVGFAARDTLSNLFAGVFIIADKPYQKGDWIVLDDGQQGRVERIGLRSTRLITRDGVEISMPNSVVGASTVTNLSGGLETHHRLRVAVGVAYGSDIDQVREILLDIAAEHPKVDNTKHKPAVRFRSFGDSSLDFHLLCWIEDPGDRGLILDELNCAVYKRFAAANIEIPFPQQDIYIRQLARQES
ncbi:MAG: mechanosensitive ion channel family protein [Myxococcota bacterium]|nr:mechanosensitive ion channel family protein [Myxococcota bacterium]